MTDETERTEEARPQEVARRYAYEFGTWRQIAMATTVPVKRPGGTVRKPVKKGG